MSDQTASYVDVVCALPFMTRAELSMVIDIIGELQPSLISPGMRVRPKPFEPEEFRRERMAKLTEALETIKVRNHG